MVYGEFRDGGIQTGTLAPLIDRVRETENRRTTVTARLFPDENLLREQIPRTAVYLTLWYTRP